MYTETKSGTYSGQNLPGAIKKGSKFCPFLLLDFFLFTDIYLYIYPGNFDCKNN